MPNTPANTGTSAPSSSSGRGATSRRTGACAVVSRTVSAITHSNPAGGRRHGTARIRSLVFPRIPDPRVRRVVAERHRARVAGTGENVQVVHRVVRSGDARPVVPVRDEDD